VNANPSDGLYLTEMLEAMPEARMVYILRHPQEVVWSALHAPWADPAERHRPAAVRQAALHWRQHAEIAKQVTDGLFGDSVLLIRHEELIRDPERIAKKLAAHVDVNPDPAIAELLGAPTFNSSFRNSVSAKDLVAESRRAISRARSFRHTVFGLVGTEMEALDYADLGNPPLVARSGRKAAFSIRS
jgi:hypothetical protein